MENHLQNMQINFVSTVRW